MELGYLVGGVACTVYGLLCVGIGAFRPQSLMKFVKKKFKMFPGAKEPSDKATVIICLIFGAAALIAAAVLFIVGAANM